MMKVAIVHDWLVNYGGAELFVEYLLKMYPNADIYTLVYDKKKMGNHFKTLDKWQQYIITSHESFARLFGRKPDKIRKLYNGMIPCSLYQYFKPTDTKFSTERKQFDKPYFKKK